MHVHISKIKHAQYWYDTNEVILFCDAKYDLKFLFSCFDYKIIFIKSY